MSLPRFAVRRPVTMTMIFLGLALLGVTSWFQMPQELFPAISYPQVTVATRYAHAAPEEMEMLVTTPLEEALGTVSRIKNIRSISREGLSLVMVQFEWGTDMDFAALHVREKVERAKNKLPEDVEESIVLKFNPFQLPVLLVSVSSGLSLEELGHVVRDIIKPALEKVSGVASVQMSGGRTQEICVDVDAGRLAATGLSLLNIIETLKNSNRNYPAGTMSEAYYEYLIRTIGEFKDISDIGRVMVLDEEREPIAIKDVAHIEARLKKQDTYARHNGRDTIALAVQRQADANIIQVARDVHRALEELRAILPMGVDVEVLYDQSTFIKKSIYGVLSAAIFGGFLAFVVLLFFLRDVAAAVIVAACIPVSILFALVLMYWNDVSLNMMSLGGMALGVGMMVDNAIVVIENIFRHHCQGQEEKSPKDMKKVAVKGTEEVYMAIGASTLTTLAVFLPMVFVPGLAGQLFRDFAFSVSGSLVASLLVSVTLIPRLVAHRPMGVPLGHPMFEWFDKHIEGLTRWYGRMLPIFYAHRWRYGGVLLGLAVVCVVLVPFQERVLMPMVDQKQFVIHVDMPMGTPIGRTNSLVNKMEQVLLASPLVGQVHGAVGADAQGDIEELVNMLGPHQGRIVVDIDAHVLLNTRVGMAQLRDDLASLVPERTEVKYIVQENIFKFMDALTGPLTVWVRGEDLGVIRELSLQVAEMMRGVVGVKEVTEELEQAAPETKIVIDKDRAALYGLAVDKIAEVAQASVAGVVPTTLKQNGREIDIRVRVADAQHQKGMALLHMGLPAQKNISIPLEDVAMIEQGQGPSAIERINGGHMAAIAAQPKQGFSSSVVRRNITEALEQLSLPADYSIQWSGSHKDVRESFHALIWVLGLSIVLVYMVIASQFESLLQPLIILWTVPLGFMGAFFMLFIFGVPISLMVFLGLMMLAGIVVNNGIVLVDYTKQLSQTLPLMEACWVAAKTRLRPIVMTALTTVLGLLPLAMGLGDGGKLSQPMALTVVGGLLFSTALTLFVVPTLILACSQKRL